MLYLVDLQLFKENVLFSSFILDTEKPKDLGGLDIEDYSRDMKLIAILKEEGFPKTLITEFGAFTVNFLAIKLPEKMPFFLEHIYQMKSTKEIVVLAAIPREGDTHITVMKDVRIDDLEYLYDENYEMFRTKVFSPL